MQAKWIGRELTGLDLGDRRRARRTRALLEDLSARPEASIPQACAGAAKTKAAYRLLDSEIDPEALRAPHEDSTRERARQAGRVRVVEDTTALDFTTHRAMRDLGPLDSSHCRGLKVQTSLVLTPQGLPLGVLDQRVWVRDPQAVGQRHQRRQRAPEQKESWRWRVGVERTQEKLPEEVEVLWIADRESDIYFVLATPRRAGMELLIRATHNRALEEPEGVYLRQSVATAPLLGRMSVELPRTRGRRTRTATLELRSTRVKIAPPRHAKQRAALPAVELWAVEAQEQGPVAKGQKEKAIRWLLLSTRPIECLEEAIECVEAYTERWKVERYHYVLKSGCKIEALQLQSAKRLERALALYSMIAWRLLYLTYRARHAPEAPCSEVLQEAQWKALYAMTAEAIPEQAPGLREATRRIATLGGFLGRKGDGEPGVKALWTGWRRLADFTLAFNRLSQTCG